MPAAWTRAACVVTSIQRNIRMNTNAIDQAELDRLGIRRIPTEVFVWGDFRYSNAHDAIAAARRAEKK